MKSADFIKAGCTAEDTATNVSGTTATAIEEAIANLEMKSPQTEDSSMIELWLILLLISGCVLLGVNIHFKAKKTIMYNGKYA